MMKKTLLLIGAALCCMATLSSCEKEKMNSMHYDLEGQPLPTQQGAELAALNSRAPSHWPTRPLHTTLRVTQ